MLYDVTITMLCDEKAIEKLRSRLEKWKHDELVFSFKEDREDERWGPIPAHWCLYADFDESEKTNVFSLPFIIEDLGGIITEISIQKIDKLMDDWW